MRKLITTSMLVMALATGGGVHAADGPVAAKVNGTVITVQDIDDYSNAVGQAKGFKPKPGYAANELIKFELLAQEAIRRGMDKNLDKGDLVIAVVQQFRKEHPLTEEDVIREYNQRKAQAPDNPQYQVQGLAFATEKEAKAVIAGVTSGEPLRKYSAQSVDKNAKADGGEMGWFAAEDMHASFQRAVTSLKAGEVYQEPINMAGAYYVVRLGSIKNNNFPDYDEVKVELSKEMGRARYDAFLQDLTAKSNIERRPGYEEPKVLDPLNLRKAR